MKAKFFLQRSKIDTSAARKVPEMCLPSLPPRHPFTDRAEKKGGGGGQCRELHVGQGYFLLVLK
jgi:hypothetical protein